MIPMPYRDPTDLDGPLEQAIRSTAGWPRLQRHALGGVLFLGYLVAARFRAGFVALALAIAFYGSLQRWVIEEPEPGQWADAYWWALATLLTSVATFTVWWWALGSEALRTWATHVWLPSGIIGVALALDRRQRRATPAEAIGQALAAGRGGRRRPTSPPSAGQRPN